MVKEIKNEKKIFYWSPCLNNVGTIKSTINSALSLKKYDKNNEVFIINACGEWNNHKKILLENSIIFLDLNFNYYKFLPKEGYIQSRLSYLLIYVLSFVPLIKLLKKHKPDIFFIHLITSLPLTILKIFDLKTDFVLRISGYPKFNIFRKILWKSISNKIKFITCPTLDLKNKLEQIKIFENKKLFFLPDAIVRTENLIRDKNFVINDNIPKNKKIILSAGRLTNQKNHAYLISEFSKFSQKNDQFILLILGDGEKKDELKNLVKREKIENKVFFIGFKKNIYSYMRSCDVFVMPSLWEEVGFVIVEAALCDTFVISSDCPNGPREFLNDGKNGILFKSNIKNELLKSFEKFSDMANKEIYQNKVRLKKEAMKYTIFHHYLGLNKILKILNKK